MEQWLIKLSDDELKLVTSDELLQMEKTAEEFDGFYGWQVLGKLNKHDVIGRLSLKEIEMLVQLKHFNDWEYGNDEKRCNELIEATRNKIGYTKDDVKDYL
jgi:hypothetical protein